MGWFYIWNCSVNPCNLFFLSYSLPSPKIVLGIKLNIVFVQDLAETKCLFVKVPVHY